MLENEAEPEWVNEASAMWEGRLNPLWHVKALNPHCFCGVGRREQEKAT